MVGLQFWFKSLRLYSDVRRDVREKRAVLWKLWYQSNSSRTWPSNLTFSLQRFSWDGVNASDKTWEDSLLIQSVKSSIVRDFSDWIFSERTSTVSCAPPFLVNLSTWIQTVWKPHALPFFIWRDRAKHWLTRAEGEDDNIRVGENHLLRPTANGCLFEISCQLLWSTRSDLCRDTVNGYWKSCVS